MHLFERKLLLSISCRCSQKTKTLRFCMLLLSKAQKTMLAIPFGLLVVLRMACTRPLEQRSEALSHVKEVELLQINGSRS